MISDRKYITPEMYVYLVVHPKNPKSSEDWLVCKEPDGLFTIIAKGALSDICITDIIRMYYDEEAARKYAYARHTAYEVEQHITWRNVFEYKGTVGLNTHIELGNKAGYTHFSFGGKIMRLIPDEHLCYEETGLTIKDLKG